MGRNSGGGVRNSNTGRRFSEFVKEAIDYYVDGNGYGLNYSLRNGEELEGEDAMLKKGMDQATAKPLSKSYTLYRGVSASSIFGDDVQYGLVKSAIIDGDREPYVMEALNKAQATALKVKKDKGYMSCSKKPDTAEGFGGTQNVVMKMTVKKGTKGIDLTENRSVYKNNTNEQEVILARGLSYRVTKIYSSNGLIYVDAEIL